MKPVFALMSIQLQQAFLAPLLVPAARLCRCW